MSNMDFNNTTALENLTQRLYIRQPSKIGIEDYILIVIYALIFSAAVIGNSLVIFTLVYNKRMRTVTNMFLLNLAISDLLLAIFCMPFTLIPMFLENFIFGATVCVLIRYLQGVSVTVSCFTLVAISLERYFGICRPLRSRRWQTISHSYKVLIICWLLAAIVIIPVAVNTKYRKLKFTLERYKCDEIWDNDDLEKAYTVLLNIILLVGPIILMIIAYGCIIYTLWEGITSQSQQNESNGISNGKMSTSSKLHNDNSTVKYADYGTQHHSPDNGCGDMDTMPRRNLEFRRGIRRSNPERNRAAKLKVIRMLVVVCLEFFICWTPLYVVLTWKTFHVKSLMNYFTPVKFTFILVLSYVSTICNPITYCFMNQKFRQSFIMILGCCRPRLTRRFSSHSTSMKLNGTKLSIIRSKNTSKLSQNERNVSPDDQSLLVIIGNSSDGAAV